MVVMDYAPGVTLAQWRRQFPDGKVPLDRAIAVVRQVASALDYAHGQKVLHRDVKPANVIVETSADGRRTARVLDFGLAAEIRSSMGRLSREIRDTSGTHPYMAPEQWLGHRQGPATDQYALAVIFYELVVGEVPFASVFDCGDPAVMRLAVTTDAPDVPSDLPKEVRNSLAKALAKKPEERFASCVEFVDALEGKVKVSRRGAGTRRGGSGIWKTLCVLALLAALAGSGLWWTVNEKGMNGTTETARTTNAPSVSSVSSVPSVPSVPVVSDSRQPTNDSSRAAAEVASRQAEEANARERAAEFIRLKTRISIKQSDAKHKMDSIAGFREDQDGLEEHIKSADREWKTLSALPAPETLEEAQAAFEIADKAEAQIALDLDWLTKNKAGRDAAKAVKSEIVALLAGDIATFKAEKYAADAFREGGKLREAADAAFEKGDFGEAGRMMGEAKEKFASAAHDAKSFFIKTTLESAKTYFDAAKWDDCIAECGKVLGRDASNETAKKLNAEAEAYLVPTARAVAMIGDREVSGAKFTFGGKTCFDPKWDKLSTGASLFDGGVSVEYTEGDKRYVGRLSGCTVNWRGPTNIVVMLEERIDPTTVAYWKRFVATKDGFLGMKFGEELTGMNFVSDSEEPTLLRATFTPMNMLAGFDDYYVYVTPKSHKVVKVYACAKEAVGPGTDWKRHYIINALEKCYNTKPRPRSWTRPIYSFDIGSGRFVTACLAGSSRDYETVIVAWDDALLTVASEETKDNYLSAATRRR